MGGTCESKNIEHVRNVAVRSCLNQENKDGHNIPTCSWNHQSGAATIDVTCAEGYKPRGGVPTADPQTQQLLCNSNQWNDFSCARSNSPSIISASNHVTCENRTDGVKCWGIFDHDKNISGRTVIRVQPNPESVRVVHIGGENNTGSPVDEPSCKSIHRSLNRGRRDKWYVKINNSDYPQGCSARYFRDDILLQYNNATTGKPNASAIPITQSFLPEQKAFYQFEYEDREQHKTSYAIGKDGTVLAWGSNQHGALGYLPVKAVDGTCPKNYKKGGSIQTTKLTNCDTSALLTCLMLLNSLVKLSAAIVRCIKTAGNCRTMVTSYSAVKKNICPTIRA